eukprot:2679003-Alexandrium_andersonii.AAC.1
MRTDPICLRAANTYAPLCLNGSESNMLHSCGRGKKHMSAPTIPIHMKLRTNKSGSQLRSA